MTFRLALATWAVIAVMLVRAAPALAAPALTPEQLKDLKQNFAFCVSKLKGPYIENTCVCPNGTKRPIRGAGGALGTACEKPVFCAAYRAAWAEALTKHRLYLGNIFPRDVYEWGSYADHNDVVRGYILEKYFVDTNPAHKLAQLRWFRGLSSSEEVAPAAARFYEKYLGAPEFDANADFLLAYELQRRFFVRADIAQIEKLRTAATRVEAMDRKFKLLKDAIHIQVVASLVGPLSDYRDKLPQGTERKEIQGLIDQIVKLTSIDESALAPAIASLEDGGLQKDLARLLPSESSAPLDAIASLSQLMAVARKHVESKRVAPADARRLVDLDVMAAASLRKRAEAAVKSGLAVPQSLQLLGSLATAGYGAGLLSERERDDAIDNAKRLMASPQPSRPEFRQGLARAKQVLDWAQTNATQPFAEVWAAWTAVLPEVKSIGNDIVRDSPLGLYGAILTRLDELATGNAS